MKTESILISLKDVGGVNNVLPIAQELEKRGHQVQLIANTTGVAVEFLEKHKRNFLPVEKVEEVLSVAPNPKLLITSMCNNHLVGKNLVEILKNKCPVVAVQDYWGVRLTDEWSEIKYRPDYIVVNDQLGADLVKKAWPEFKLSRIWQTGFPMFDAYSGITRDDEIRAREEILTKLNAEARVKIVFFPCGAIDGAGEFLSEVLSAFHDFLITRKFIHPLKFIPRCHPKLKRESVAANEMEIWNRAISSFETKHQDILVTDETIIRSDMQKLLLAADLVISDYSTSLLEAGLVGGKLNGKPNISACYVPAIARDMKRDLGPLLDEPPFVTLGCSAKTKNRTELQHLLSTFIGDDGSDIEQHLKNNQKKYLKTDGQNSKRVVDLIEALV